MGQTIHFCDANLIPIWEKVQRGEKLALEDVPAMFGTNDIISLGEMAHFVQKDRSGDAVYFVLNQKIEPTNLCVLACEFCDFVTKAGHPAAYEMSDIRSIFYLSMTSIQRLARSAGSSPGISIRSFAERFLGSVLTSCLFVFCWSRKRKCEFEEKWTWTSNTFKSPIME